MELIICVICIIIVIVALLALIISTNKQSYQILVIRMEEAIKNIEYFLEKKEENLEKAIPLIKESNKRKYGKKEILENLIKNKNIKQNLYEKDKNLSNDLKEFKLLLEEDEKLLKNKEISEIYFESIETENDLNASKKYFNKIVTKCDNEFKKFPKNILKNILKYKKEEKFTIKKEQTLEILKEEEQKKSPKK